MLIKMLTASVFIFDCGEFLLTVELYLSALHFSFAVFFVKRAAESSAPVRNKLYFLNSNYKDNNKNGYNWNKTLHNNWKLTIINTRFITYSFQSKKQGRIIWVLTFIYWMKSDAGHLGGGTTLRFTPWPIFNPLKLPKSAMNIAVSVKHGQVLPRNLLSQSWKG